MLPNLCGSRKVSINSFRRNTRYKEIPFPSLVKLTFFLIFLALLRPFERSEIEFKNLK